MAWQTPKTDWITNPIKPRSQDFNRIEGNIAYLKDEIETKKGAIVDALNAIDQPASMDDSYTELANKILNLNRRRWASGTISNNPNSGLVVTGLPFKPSAVMIYNSYFSNPYYYVRQILLQAGAGVSHYKIVHTYRLNVNTQAIDQIGGSVLSNGIVVTDDGFSVDEGALMTGTSRTLEWIAFE